MVKLCNLEVKIKREYGMDSVYDILDLDNGLSVPALKGINPLNLTLQVWIQAQGAMTTEQALDTLINSLSQAQLNGSKVTLEDTDSSDIIAGEYYVQNWTVEEEMASYASLTIILTKENLG